MSRAAAPLTPSHSQRKHLIIAEAPSNIALIKYMGKIKKEGNVPTNGSFSLTLPHLITRVEIAQIDGPEDRWSCLSAPDLLPLAMNDFSIMRYLQFFGLLKQALGVTGFYQVQSANNFAADCGIASSASSFAALTEATVELSGQTLSLQERAELSRKGSGSSGRSFFQPYCLWSREGFFEAVGPKTLHFVVVATGDKKKVSSSEAHQRVSSSLLFQGRPERAEVRLRELMQSFSTQDWQKSFEICWSEFWDMHALFETADPAFGYLSSTSLKVLMRARELWQREKDGPLVTMDAGPNVHLLFRVDQRETALRVKQEWSDLGMISGDL